MIGKEGFGLVTTMQSNPSCRAHQVVNPRLEFSLSRRSRILRTPLVFRAGAERGQDPGGRWQARARGEGDCGAVSGCGAWAGGGYAWVVDAYEVMVT